MITHFAMQSVHAWVLFCLSRTILVTRWHSSDWGYADNGNYQSKQYVL